MAERAINYIKENKRRARAPAIVDHRDGETKTIRRAFRIAQKLSP